MEREKRERGRKSQDKIAGKVGKSKGGGVEKEDEGGKRCHPSFSPSREEKKSFYYYYTSLLAPSSFFSLALFDVFSPLLFHGGKFSPFRTRNYFGVCKSCP